MGGHGLRKRAHFIYYQIVPNDTVTFLPHPRPGWGLCAGVAPATLAPPSRPCRLHSLADRCALLLSSLIENEPPALPHAPPVRVCSCDLLFFHRGGRGVFSDPVSDVSHSWPCPRSADRLSHPHRPLRPIVSGVRAARPPLCVVHGPPNLRSAGSRSLSSSSSDSRPSIFRPPLDLLWHCHLAGRPGATLTSHWRSPAEDLRSGQR